MLHVIINIGSGKMFFKKKEPVRIEKNGRILGSLFGFFVGDALGVPVEFVSRDELKRKK